jgi:hypothetical protein
VDQEGHLGEAQPTKRVIKATRAIYCSAMASTGCTRERDTSKLPTKRSRLKSLSPREGEDMIDYKLFYRIVFAGLVFSAVAEPSRALPICQDVKLCQTTPPPGCHVYHSDCRVPPDLGIDNGKRFSIEIKDLSENEAKALLDQLEVDRSKPDQPK